jgi:hypothetical protein
LIGVKTEKKPKIALVDVEFASREMTDQKIGSPCPLEL